VIDGALGAGLLEQIVGNLENPLGDARLIDIGMAFRDGDDG